MTLEQKARVDIDALLVAAGWHMCDVADAHTHADIGVAVRKFSSSFSRLPSRLAPSSRL